MSSKNFQNSNHDVSHVILCHIKNSEQKIRWGDLFSTREKCARKDREHSISNQRASVVVTSNHMQKVCKIYSWIFASIFDFVKMKDKPQGYDGIEVLQSHSQSNLKAPNKFQKISKSAEEISFHTR